MKVLITGATGFIGGNLAKRLKNKGYEVCILVKNENQKVNNSYKTIVYNEDLENLISDFKKEKFDVVIHLAAAFVAEHKAEDVDNLLKSNIILTTHILEAMINSDVKQFINTSTAWQHYHNELYNPVCLYAATKQASEDIIKFYSFAHEIKAITLTIFDSYGPNDTRKKLFYALEKANIEKTEINLSLGEQYIDYIYIKDILDAYEIALNMISNVHGFNKYYLNSESPLKLKDIIIKYQEIMGVDIKVNFGAREYRKREVMDTYKFGERLPNWYPKYTLEEGLKEIKNVKNKTSYPK